MLKNAINSFKILQAQPCFNYLPKRWATKPRWIPIAKSKRFKIFHTPALPMVQRLEQTRLTNRYKTHMRSIKKLLTDLQEQQETSQEVLDRLAKEDEDDWKKCMALNDEWNAEVGAAREQRVARELQKELEEIALKVKEKELEAENQLNRVEELVKKEKELSEHYITEANIDQAIQGAIAMEPVDYNFAIDLEGNRYEGYNVSPSGKYEKEELSEQMKNVLLNKSLLRPQKKWPAKIRFGKIIPPKGQLWYSRNFIKKAHFRNFHKKLIGI